MPENREPKNDPTPAGAADLDRKLGELFARPRDAQAKADDGPHSTPPRPRADLEREARALLADSATERPRAPAAAPVVLAPDDRIEAAYWRFDTLRGGQLRQSDRDAFKGAIRAYLGGTLEGDIVPAPTTDENDGAMLNRLGMDGMLWAREYVGQYGGDVGLMVAWFANAIMAGYDRGCAAGVREARQALEVPLAPRGDGEPENTISRMVAAIEAAAVEIGPTGAQRLRACWLEVQDLRRGTAQMLEQVRAERAVWIDRAAGLYYVIDRIDDHAEFLDPSEPAAGITRQIDRSRVIVHTDHQDREVWGTPTARNVDGAAVWWPPTIAEMEANPGAYQIAPDGTISPR